MTRHASSEIFSATSRNIRGVVFDLDGTLIDSAPVLQHILNGMRVERGLSPLQLNRYRDWSSVGGTALIQNALEVVDVEAATPLLGEFRKRYAHLPTPRDCMFAGVDVALADLKKRSISLSICSNKPVGLCRKVLTELGLIDFFPIIMGGDSLASKKPDPEILIHTVRLMNMEIDDIVFVGDSIVDFETARNAGAQFMIFEGGYNFGVDFESCDYRLTKFSRLKTALWAKSHD